MKKEKGGKSKMASQKADQQVLLVLPPGILWFLYAIKN
jgi:hypothetical protein